MVCAAWLVAPPLLPIATTGAVVSSVKLSEAVPVLPNVSVWLATMVWAPSASPLGVNDQPPVASAVTVVAMALPSMREMHHGAGKPAAGRRIVRGDAVARRGAGVDGQRLGRVGPVVLSVEGHRAAAAGIAGGVGDPGDDAVAAIARQRDPVLQLPSLPTVAVPSAVALPLSNSVTVLPASAISTVPVMVCAAWLVAPPRLPIATTGAVVSSVKLSEAVPVLPKHIGLARHDGVGAVGKPARGERPAALRIGGHGGGDGAAVDGEVHHGAGKPGAGQRIVRGDAIAG